MYGFTPVQRIFHDIHVAMQHMMVGPESPELTGGLFLGRETDVSLQ